MVIASLGAFLVLEAREHALAREAKPLARLSAVLSDRNNRQGDATKATLTRMWSTLAPQLSSGPHRRDLGRIGSRAGDVGGTRLPRHRPRGSGACDRHLCRPRL
jgi:hypothetical protein